MNDTPIDFHVNFWSLLFSLLGFVLAVYGIAAARAKASADDMDKIKAEQAKIGSRMDVQDERIGQAVTEPRLNALLEPKLNGLKADINGFGGRLDRMDERLKAALTREHLNEELREMYGLIRSLEGSIGVVNSAISEIKGEFKANGATLDRLNDFLLTWSKQNHG